MRGDHQFLDAADLLIDEPAQLRGAAALRGGDGAAQQRRSNDGQCHAEGTAAGTMFVRHIRVPPAEGTDDARSRRGRGRTRRTSWKFGHPVRSIRSVLSLMSVCSVQNHSSGPSCSAPSWRRQTPRSRGRGLGPKEEPQKAECPRRHQRLAPSSPNSHVGMGDQCPTGRRA